MATHRREFRNTFPMQPHKYDTKSTNNFCRMPVGSYGTKTHDVVTVNADYSLTVSKRAFADDVVAFVLGSISSNPTISDDIKAHLARFLDAMDARALARHGYSKSEKEQAHTWTPVTTHYEAETKST